MTIAVLDKEKIAAEAGFITVYNYSAQTGEYTGAAEEYLAVGVGLPAFSTEIQPVDAPAGFVAVFDSTSWVLSDDYRGATVYSTTDRSAVVVDYIGAIKEGFVTDKPTTPYDVWSSSGWVTDNQKLKAAQVAEAQQKKTNLLAIAVSQISILQDAVDLNMATPDETAALTAWKKYRVLLSRIDMSTAPDISWPEQP
ncbi:TPA: tail fiber assembly protein [Yersinia enterocolitica]|nr:tail fiber assembly protein [Yersinia enterocolitica]